MLLLVAPACSVVPEGWQPPWRDVTVDATYDLDPAAAHRVAIPQSTRELTVLEMRTTPAELSEQFDAGVRHLRVPAGTPRVEVSCRYRVYGRRGPGDPFDTVPAPADLFPGAALVRVAYQ